MKMRKFDRKMVSAPFNERLQPQQRLKIAIALSEAVMKIATYVICRVLVEYQEQLKEERLSIAHAFLQRVTTTHMCNHQLTSEGLVYEFKGQQFQLHEQFKTMSLTRSIYEHLAMFFFLYEYPHTDEERDKAWKQWQHGVRNVPYSQAWKYLFKNQEMASLYRHMSMHCHPVYHGLMQYQSQESSDQGGDGVPLHLSSCLLAYLCKLFLKQIPHGDDILKQEFSCQELVVFDALCQLLAPRDSGK